MLRTIVGVIIGWLIFAASATLLFRLSGHEPHAPATSAFMAGTIVYGVAFAFIGGLLAAAIAKRTGAGLAVGIIIAIGAVITLIMQPTGRWSPLAALVVMAPAAAFGGIARRGRSETGQA